MLDVRPILGLFLRHMVLLVIALLLVMGVIYRQEIFQLEPNTEKMLQAHGTEEQIAVSAVAPPITDSLPPSHEVEEQVEVSAVASSITDSLPSSHEVEEQVEVSAVAPPITDSLSSSHEVEEQVKVSVVSLPITDSLPSSHEVEAQVEVSAVAPPVTDSLPPSREVGGQVEVSAVAPPITDSLSSSHEVEEQVKVSVVSLPIAESLPSSHKVEEQVEVSAVPLPVTESFSSLSSGPADVFQPQLLSTYDEVNSEAPPSSAAISGVEGDSPVRDPTSLLQNRENSPPQQVMSLDNQESGIQQLPVTAMIPPIEAIDGRGLLKAARAAYWQVGVEQAEVLYREAIAADPSAIDGHGELANIYLSQGRSDLAREEFREVCRLMIAKGERQRAWELVSRIGVTFPELVVQLKPLFSN